MTRSAAPAASATSIAAGSEKFSPIWIGIFSSRASLAQPA